MRATLLLTVLTLVACKDDPPAPAAPPPVRATTLSKAVAMPEALEQQTLEQKARRIEGWALGACGESCDDKRLAALKRMATAKIELHERNEKPVGVRIAGVNAYSPWSVCHVQSDDVVIEVGGKPAVSLADVAAILRGCLDGEVLTVLRAGQRVALEARKRPGVAK